MLEKPRSGYNFAPKMALTSGTMLGPYEIQSPLGAGGMGEVYRARDTRLDRVVAIKILPAHLSSSPEAKQRFDREARSISALSHPNVCHLYDVGLQGGTSYLVMEYLEGETLADRLSKGPLPLGQVLKYGIEICEGLEKAHKSGVVHRDLKPGNIMLTKSGAKLMDFGLAKPAASPASSGMTQTLATPQQPLTMEGMVVGTFQYMSPEQVEGKEADQRSDIFALGAVLYEMITGRRAFAGKTAASASAAILAAEPLPISSLQPLSPPALEATVKSCLTKDPDERLQTVHDVKLQLQWMAQGALHTALPAGKAAAGAVPNRLVWLLVGLLSLVVAGESLAWWASTRHKEGATYFSSVPFPVNEVALSPDGGTAALVAYWEQANKYVVWTHEIGSRKAATVPGTENASHPFWSPDGRSLGFFADGKLKRVDLVSQSAQVLCDAPNGRGGSWNRDGVILFAPDVSGGLYRVPTSGGRPVEVTKPDTSLSQSSNRWPVFLPDQRHFLFLGANFSGEFDKNAIFVGSLDSSEKHMVVAASSNAAYADPGYLLYVRDNALVAQPFDIRTYALSGEPRSVSDDVQYFPTTDLAVFSVAGREKLLVQTGKGANKSQLLWFDRSGKQLGAVGPQGRYGNVILSPDGRRVLFDQLESDGRHWDVWLRDVTSEAMTRLTFGPGLNQLPVWSTDGKQIAYAGIRKSTWRVLMKNSDGSGSEQQIGDTTASVQGPWDWKDGRLLMSKNGELWYVPMSDLQPKPIFQGNGVVRNAQFSPDGKWITYSSNETGTREVYVSPFAHFENKWQVSRGGGTEPRWRRDGKELFFLSGDGKMISVPVKTNGTFEAGSPVTLFQTHLRQPISALDQMSYDVSADGRRFLLDAKVDDPDAVPLSIILNWAAEMEK